MVGPLSKQQFVHAFSSFEIRDAFPDLNGRYFGFTVDPQVSAHIKADRRTAFHPMCSGSHAQNDARVLFMRPRSLRLCRCPQEPNRVWFFSRARMTHCGTLKFGPLSYPPTGKELCHTPQVLSCSFDSAGRCYKLTGGYCIDRSAGHSGGLGGVFGLVHAVGGSLPFPEGRPWRPSLQWEAMAKRIPQIGLDFLKTGIWAPAQLRQ